MDIECDWPIEVNWAYSGIASQMKSSITVQTARVERDLVEATKGISISIGVRIQKDETGKMMVYILQVPKDFWQVSTSGTCLQRSIAMQAFHLKPLHPQSIPLSSMLDSQLNTGRTATSGHDPSRLGRVSHSRERCVSPASASGE